MLSVEIQPREPPELCPQWDVEGQPRLHMPLPAWTLLLATLPSGRAGLWMASEAPCVLQVAVTDLCPAGPIQAMEIQVESSSLANMCRAHHAIVGRLQVCRSSWACLGSLCGVAGTQDPGGLWLPARGCR